ncbi:radical SAM protein [Lujinxingia litoralis]|uniref:Radical SAM protein n=1 Tax=Lujinxingia litoralis TaxID=2211119 RepID=A0A328C285_9DELT|nr:radical SAM protein [Lujinxingia litoralis]RAL20025.1 radical SAM protein [Lujinxingia litoralis]
MIDIDFSAQPLPEGPAPELALSHLDTLWLQVTGTLCNLACRHCFISCGPKNESHPFMALDEVRRAVETGAAMGVKEYYFTGGEPFMHPEIREMIALTLEHGPLSVLTNGVLIDEELAAWLADTFERARYNFDVRVSLDGTTARENDAIRGRHTFEKILAGAVRLHRAGLNPVFTVTTCHAELAESAGRQRFFELLAERGITRPRLKFLAPFKIGREERRGGAYAPYERLTEDALDEEARRSLQCSSCRMVTAKGVYPCPILIEEEGARMGDRLEDALAPIRLDHPACYTCFVEGVTCRT